MAVTDATKNMTYTNRDVAGAFSKAIGQMKGIASSVKLSGGIKDFAGMDTNGLSKFETALDKYKKNIEDIVDSFNENAATTDALKGEVGSAVSGFLTAMKDLLKRYVAVIDIEKKEINEAKERYVAGASSIKTDISNDATTLRNAANGIQLD